MKGAFSPEKPSLLVSPTQVSLILMLLLFILKKAKEPRCSVAPYFV